MVELKSFSFTESTENKLCPLICTVLKFCQIGTIQKAYNSRIEQIKPIMYKIKQTSPSNDCHVVASKLILKSLILSAKTFCSIPHARSHQSLSCAMEGAL